MASRVNITTALRSMVTLRTRFRGPTIIHAAFAHACLAFALLACVSVARAIPACNSACLPYLAKMSKFASSSAELSLSGQTGEPSGTLFLDRRGVVQGARIHRDSGRPCLSPSLAACAQWGDAAKAVKSRGSQPKARSTGPQWLADAKLFWPPSEHNSPKAVLGADHQFDEGSGVAIHKLNGTQIESLLTLGKVWGFLKYHSPTITSGQRQWDYDLLRVLPAILAAPDRVSANAVMTKWIDGLGPESRCSPCAHLDQHDLQLRPDLDLGV